MQRKNKKNLLIFSKIRKDRIFSEKIKWGYCILKIFKEVCILKIPL